VAEALGWVQFGVWVGLVGVSVQLLIGVAIWLDDPKAPDDTTELFAGCFGLIVVLLSLVSFLAVIVGRRGCLHVPPGAQSHGMAVLSFAAAVLSLFCAVGGAYCLFLAGVEAKEASRSDGTILRLGLAGFIASAVLELTGEFAFLEFMRRTALFLGSQPFIERAEQARGVLITVLIGCLLLGVCTGLSYAPIAGPVGRPVRDTLEKDKGPFQPNFVPGPEVRGAEHPAARYAPVVVLLPTLICSFVLGYFYLNLLSEGRAAISRRLAMRGP
jgi:hypothetical protein